MSDTYFNIRFGTYHFQIHKYSPYVTFRQNVYQIRDREKYPTEWKWFEVYQLFGHHFI